MADIRSGGSRVIVRPIHENTKAPQAGKSRVKLRKGCVSSKFGHQRPARAQDAANAAANSGDSSAARRNRLTDQRKQAGTETEHRAAESE